MFEGKSMKVKFGKEMVVVSGSIGEILKSKVDLCAQCRRCQIWCCLRNVMNELHKRCAKTKNVF